MNNPATPTKAPTAKDAEFMFHVIANMEGRPKVDWHKVAAAMNLKSAGVAQVRFGQIKKKLGWGSDATVPSPSTPTPSKVNKRAPAKATKVKKGAAAKRGKKAKKDEETTDEDELDDYDGDEKEVKDELEDDQDDDEDLEDYYKIED